MRTSTDVQQPQHPESRHGRTPAETLGFQAEVKQLLHLMIHSLYSNKEIFLRELISNASDAADKLRFEALSDNALLRQPMPSSRIRVAFDKAARTLTMSDNGIGMSRDEVIAQHRHHRQVRHARILRGAHRRPGEGRAPDRPVRRRLLLLVHRRRPGHAGDAPRRPAGRRGGALGIRRRRRVHHRGGRQGGARHRRDPAPARGRGRAARRIPRCKAIIRKYSDHIAIPDRDEEA